MVKCDRCNSLRLIQVSAKCSDCCSVVSINDESVESIGYVPSTMGIGQGDYVNFTLCLKCGKLQGDFPITLEEEDD